MQPAYVTSIILVATLSGFAVSVWSETRDAAASSAPENRDSAPRSTPIDPSLTWRLSLDGAAEASRESGKPVLLYVRPEPREAGPLEEELARSPRVLDRLGSFELLQADLWYPDPETAQAAAATLTAFDLNTAPHFIFLGSREDGSLEILDAACPVIGAHFGANGFASELARLKDAGGGSPRTPLRGVRRLEASGRHSAAQELFEGALAEERSEVGPLHRTAALRDVLLSGTTGVELETALKELLIRESDRDVLFRGHGLIARSIESRVRSTGEPRTKRRVLGELRTLSRKLYQVTPEDRLLPVMETVLDWFAEDTEDLDSLDRIFVRNLKRRIESLDPESPSLGPR